MTNDILKELESKTKTIDITPIPKSDAEEKYKFIKVPKNVPNEPVQEPKSPEPDKKEVSESKLETDEMLMQAAYLKSLEPPHTTPPNDNPIKEEPEEAVTDEQKQEEEAVTEPVTEPVTECVTKDQDEPDEKPPVKNVEKPNIDDRVDMLFELIKGIKESNKEKDESINLLIQSNSDLFLIDMQTLSEDINDFKRTLYEIGTDDQDEEVEYALKNQGVNMALKRSEKLREDYRTSAREGIHIITSILLTMNKFNEKLKFTEEA